MYKRIILITPFKVWLKNNLWKINAFFKHVLSPVNETLRSDLSIQTIYERIKGKFEIKPLSKRLEFLIIFNQGSAIFNHYPEILTADHKKNFKKSLKPHFWLKNEFSHSTIPLSSLRGHNV